jgi:hypothetical protein
MEVVANNNNLNKNCLKSPKDNSNRICRVLPKQIRLKVISLNKIMVKKKNLKMRKI